MVRFGGPIVEINGAGPGGIWRFDWCRQHLQAPPRTWNHPVSKAQRARRRAFFDCIWRYFHVLTEQQWSLWWEWSSERPIKNKKGEDTFLQGHNMYIKYNINRRIAGKPFVDDPYNP